MQKAIWLTVSLSRHAAACCGRGEEEQKGGRGVHSECRRGSVGVRLVVVAVVVSWSRVIGQNVQLVHLRAGVQHHQLVLWNISRCCCQVCDGFALHTLEVHVPALTLLLLPGHADEGPLHVVVNDLRPAAWPLLHLFFVSRIS